MLNDEKIETFTSTKLLGTIISDDLRWDLNTKKIVKKANARMELLRRVASFGASLEDMKTIYFLFVRSHLEQSATVWHSSLTEDNSADLERVQKSAVKIMLGDNNYTTYEKSLLKLDIENLADRRKHLCLNFAKKCVKNEKTKHMFPQNVKKQSTIIYMQHLLNDDEPKN